MGTKQIKVGFLIVANDQVSANVTIAFNGVQKWSGPLANTNNSIPDYNIKISILINSAVLCILYNKILFIISFGIVIILFNLYS